MVGLVPIRGWPHRVTRASNHFAGGGAFSVVKPSPVLYRGGGEKCSLWAPSSAGSAPSCPPAVPTVLSSCPLSRAWGEVFAVAGIRDAAVVWAGGLHSGWNARMRVESGDPRAVRSVPPFLRTPVWKLFAIQAPSFGGEIAIRLGGRRANHHPSLFVVGCCLLCVLCPEDRRVVVGVLSLPTLAPAGWLECGYTLTRDQGPWWSPGTRTGGVEG